MYVCKRKQKRNVIIELNEGLDLGFMQENVSVCSVMDDWDKMYARKYEMVYLGCLFSKTDVRPKSRDKTIGSNEIQSFMCNKENKENLTKVK